MHFNQSLKCLMQRNHGGFTLVELVVVMVITGILSGMIVMLIKGPVQGYVDSARRGEINDIADTAMSRITRDVRMALPNSVRVTSGTCNGTGVCYYLEYLEMVAGGRYITDVSSSSCFSVASMVSPGVSCLTTVGDLGSVSAVLAASAVISPQASVYTGVGIATITSSSAVASGVNVINFGTTSFSPSPANRFQIVKSPVTYVCSPSAGGTLSRYWGYGIQPLQPNGVNSSNQLLGSGGTVLPNQSSALLANNVSLCSFHVSNITAGSGQSAVVVSMPLTITEQGVNEQMGESMSFYSAAQVANVP